MTKSEPPIEVLWAVPLRNLNQLVAVSAEGFVVGGRSGRVDKVVGFGRPPRTHVELVLTEGALGEKLLASLLVGGVGLRSVVLLIRRTACSISNATRK
jgi:hypothetical protein